MPIIRSHISEPFNGKVTRSGKPIPADYRACLDMGRFRERQRAAAALEMSMRKPGTPLFETRMTGFRQRQLLGC